MDQCVKAAGAVRHQRSRLLPELFLARGGSSDGRRGESDIWQNQQTAVWCCRWGEISQGNSFCSKSFCSSYVECAVTVFSDTHTRFRFFPNFEWTLNYEEYLDIWICKLIIKPPLLGIHLQLQLLFPAWDGDVVAHTGLVHEGLPPSQSQANGFTNKSRSFENPFSFTLSSLHLSLCVQRADRTIEAWTDMTAKRGWRLPLSPFFFLFIEMKGRNSAVYSGVTSANRTATFLQTQWAISRSPTIIEVRSVFGTVHTHSSYIDIFSSCRHVVQRGVSAETECGALHSLQRETWGIRMHHQRKHRGRCCQGTMSLCTSVCWSLVFY